MKACRNIRLRIDPNKPRLRCRWPQIYIFSCVELPDPTHFLTQPHFLSTVLFSGPSGCRPRFRAIKWKPTLKTECWIISPSTVRQRSRCLRMAGKNPERNNPAKIWSNPTSDSGLDSFASRVNIRSEYRMYSIYGAFHAVYISSGSASAATVSTDTKPRMFRPIKTRLKTRSSRCQEKADCRFGLFQH